MTSGKWIGLGVTAALIAIVVSAVILFTPAWERKHYKELTDLQTEADRLLANGKTKESYRQYQRLFALIGDRKISDRYIAQEIDAARASMQTAYQQAKPIIDREEAEAREQQRQQELRRQREIEEARVRQAREEAQRKEDEAKRAAEARAKQDQEKLARDERQRRVQHELAMQKFRTSHQYRSIRNAARDIVSTLRIDMIGEDSAYRSISRRASANCALLALYVKLQGFLADEDVSKQVDFVTDAFDTDMIGEDSAIRAVYKKDRCFLKLLGVWCDLLDKQSPGIAAGFEADQQRADLALAGDDSAPRAIAAYSSAVLRVLSRIASSKGKATKASAIEAKLLRDNIGEDSAYRSVMRNAKANLDLTLAMIDHDSDPAIRQIRSRAIINTVTDDSALRAQSEYRQGMVDALNWLIDHP